MHKYLLLIVLAIIVVNCNSQTKESDLSVCKDREAIVAGSFYPDDAKQLKAQLDLLFARCAHVKTYDDVLAIISPHAGYVYSGTVAASAFSQINQNKNYKNVFVIASSHRVAFEGASIYNAGNYETPLGEIETDKELISI